MSACCTAESRKAATFFPRNQRKTKTSCASTHPSTSDKLKTGSLSYAEILQLEIPYSEELIEACWLAAGGSILAGQKALQDGWSANIGGGFHHACPDHGEGFCVIHDVAIAIRRLQSDKAIERAMVIDTDVHHGNGTAAIFAADKKVFTLSIHQLHNYPFVKPPSTMDINLPDGVGDEDYLRSWRAFAQEHSPISRRKLFSTLPEPTPIAKTNSAAWR